MYHLYHRHISPTNFVKYHWQSRDHCIAKISHQLTSWDIIDYHWLSLLVIDYYWLLIVFTEYLKNGKCSLTDLVPTWNQEMLAHLKMQTVLFFRHLILKSLDRIFCHSFLKIFVLVLFVLLGWIFGEKQMTKPDYFPALFQLFYCVLVLSKMRSRVQEETKSPDFPSMWLSVRPERW